MAADGRGSSAGVSLCRRGQARPRVLWRLDPLLDRALLPGCAPSKPWPPPLLPGSAPVEAIIASSYILGIPRPSLVLCPSAIANPFSYTHRPVVTPRHKGSVRCRRWLRFLGRRGMGVSRASRGPGGWDGWGFASHLLLTRLQDTRKEQVVTPTPAQITTTKLRAFLQSHDLQDTPSRCCFSTGLHSYDDIDSSSLDVMIFEFGVDVVITNQVKLHAMHTQLRMYLSIRHLFGG